MGYFDRIEEVLDAATPVIMLRTTEFERAYAGLKKWCRGSEAVLYKWNCVEGLLEVSLRFDTVMAVDERVSDLLQILVEVERRQDSSEMEVFVVEGVYDFMYRADVKILLRKLTVDLPKSGGKKRVILLNPVPELPYELCNSIPVLELPLPDAKELSDLLQSQIKAVGATVVASVKDAMVEAALGMTMEMATLAFKVAGIRTEYSEEAAAVVRESHGLFMEAKPYS